jgi:serine/threonine protein kinase/tetratricopeptide (TPR) repeat protein
VTRDPIARLNTALEGLYRIERELGEGGMATVYLANDLKHERKVALKVLKAELAAVVGAERFLAEIKTTANLQHPHILPLFDSGEADGFLYYIMPYVHGESLRERLDREHQLPIPDAVRIAVDIAEALDYAHRQGVIHRDIKPANTLLQDGKAVLSDFGIALAVGKASEGRLTETGTSLGTPYYMSPEQAAGERVLDGRSDLYSLGCVLYEMLLGEPPFTGSSAQAIVAKRFVQAPADVTALRDGVPEAVGRALTKVLSRSPVDRFSAGADLARALAGTASPDGAGESKAISIAVLPFKNLSPDPENEYFADGIAEELLNLLTTIPDLRVVSRSTAFSFKGKDVPATDLARQLNVGHLLEGSVRKAGNRVRIAAKLVAATSDSHLWSETFDRMLDDVFAIQDEIAAAVVGKLKISLLGPVPSSQETDPAVYALFLQARHLASKLTAEAAREADELYRQVLEQAPDYAPAWTGSAINHVNQRWLAGSDEHRVYQLAREAVTKALELDPADAMAHAVQGTIAMGYDCDFPGAARHYQRALELAPNSYDILQQAGWFLGMLGRTDEAIAVHEHLTQREPLNPMAPGCLAWLQNSARRPEAAIEAARMTMRVSPTFVDNQCALGWGLLGSGRPEEALTAIEQETNPNVRLWSLSAAHWALGNADEAKAATAQLIADYGQRNPMLIAAAVAGQGDVDGAFEWLERAATEGDPIFYELHYLGWVWESIDDDPRWLPFLQRSRMSPADLDAIEFTVPIAGTG